MIIKTKITKNEEFLEDLIHQDIAPVSKMSKYLNKEEDE